MFDVEESRSRPYEWSLFPEASSINTNPLEAIMAQTRVHELAKEFGVDSKTILKKFKEMGEFVRSSSSIVPLPVEMRFRKEFGDELRQIGTAPPPSRPVSQTPPGSDRIPMPYQRRGAPRPSRRPAPPPDQNLRDAARIFGVPVEELKSARDDRPRGRYASSESRRTLTEWDRNWIEAEERREWINAGIGHDDGRIAGQLKERGITPDDLLLRIDGIRVNDRLRGGESIGSIVARLREYKRNRDAG
ncbi:MAG: translation initiation factor IF-2 N-terminal domain-containing protein [Nocardioides sp.]